MIKKYTILLALAHAHTNSTVGVPDHLNPELSIAPTASDIITT
jgi:hypothetical protein